jgi:NADP-dependent 3-hydroxy acid dehydrogenase YdfG
MVAVAGAAARAKVAVVTGAAAGVGTAEAGKAVDARLETGCVDMEAS